MSVDGSVDAKGAVELAPAERDTELEGWLAAAVELSGNEADGAVEDSKLLVLTAGNVDEPRARRYSLRKRCSKDNLGHV